MRQKLLDTHRYLAIYAVLGFLLVNGVAAQGVTEERMFRETGKLYTQLAADTLIQQGKLASTPALALVGLTFDRDGSLLTAKEFNALIANNAWDARRYKNFWTDFTTYQTVLRKAQKLGLQSQARVHLVKDYRYVMPPPSVAPKGPGPYLFDAFQKFYQTWDEAEKEMERKTRRQAP